MSPRAGSGGGTPPKRAPSSEPRWRTAARGGLPYVVAAVSGFLLAYVLVYLFVFPTRLVPDDRPVPDVRGLLADDAQRALRDAGFDGRVGAQRLNASVPAGTVLEQAPAPATQKPRGAPVSLTVAAAP